MNNRRICTKVIKQMIDKISLDKVEFIKDLEQDLKDAFYKPSEEVIQWNRVHSTILKHINNPPKEEWEYEVLSVFTTHSIEDLKKMVTNEQ